MTIYRVGVSLVAAHHIGAHILPPDGKNAWDEGAERFCFYPSVQGARGLNDSEISLLQRSRIELMQMPTRPLHSAGIHSNLMIVSNTFADLVEDMAPHRHQFVPLDDVWFKKAKEPSPGQYQAVLIMDYAQTVDVEKSAVSSVYLPKFERTSYLLAAVYPIERVVRSATAKGRNIWADEVTGTIFCNEDFKVRAEALKGTLGLDFGLCTEI